LLLVNNLRRAIIKVGAAFAARYFQLFDTVLVPEDIEPQLLLAFNSVPKQNMGLVALQL
jgi:hypothetical protein